jgi:hypothetical protein
MCFSRRGAHNPPLSKPYLEPPLSYVNYSAIEGVHRVHSIRQELGQLIAGQDDCHYDSEWSCSACSSPFCLQSDLANGFGAHTAFELLVSSPQCPRGHNVKPQLVRV